MNPPLRISFIRPRTFAGVFALSLSALAQFREIGPPPFPPAQAHEKVRLLLEQVDPVNRRQTAKTIVGWLDWYRDVVDDEMIAAWKGENRVTLNLVVDELGDARVAAEIARSWRQPGLNPAAAPILTKLITRYSESGAPFVHDLLRTPELSGPEAETVCRVLLDLPDRWRDNALQVLPHYRGAAQSLLAKDLRESDEEKVGRAQFWLRDLRWNAQDDASGGSGSRQAPRRREPAAITSSDPPPLRPPQPTVSQTTYIGAPSGTLTCGGVIPQNAEFVFRNLPRGQLKLDYDTKNWNARLVAGEGETQRLILTNVSSGPQKKCVVHWSAIR